MSPTPEREPIHVPYKNPAAAAGNLPSTATRRIRIAETALQQRMEFEALVARISGLFSSLRPDQVDWGIHEALRQMGEFLEVDHCHACQVYANGDLLDHTHSWSFDGVEAPWNGIRGLNWQEVLPSVSSRLLRLDGMAVYSVHQMGPEAQTDQQTFYAQGIGSVIFVPMAMLGKCTGFISLDCVGREMQWTEDSIALLRIVAAIIADGLERKRTDEALRKENEFSNALFNATGALFMVLNREGRIVRFNKAAEEASGYALAEVQDRFPWEDLVPREERVAERKRFMRMVAGAPPTQAEGGFLTKEGQRRIISWSYAALHGPDQSVDYVIMSGIDVTVAKHLEADILSVAEGEQSRIGHDLHDGLGQHLTGVEFMAQVIVQRLEAAGRPEARDMEEITRLIREAIAQTRDLARGLSPVVLQKKGLPVALTDLAESISARMQVHCTCEVSMPPPIVDYNTSIHLYRIAQEAAANAVKHGKATAVAITLEEHHNRLKLTIADNGSGLPDNHGVGQGMGLRVMTYRAGIIGATLDMYSTPGQGVMIQCSLAQSDPQEQPTERLLL